MSGGREDVLKPKLKDVNHSANQTLCRNILIHGYCKFADKGCIFNHENYRAFEKNNAPFSSEIFKKNITDVALITSNDAFPKLYSRSIAQVPDFVPRSKLSLSNQPSNFQSSVSIKEQDVLPELVSYDLVDTNFKQSFGIDQEFSKLDINFALDNHSSFPFYDANSASSSNFYDHEIYYTQTPVYQPLQYHLYASHAPYRENLEPYQRTIYDFFISNTLREDLQRKSEAIHQILLDSNLPSQILGYHSLVPLDTLHNRNTRIFGYPSWVYKVFSSNDGYSYVFRRLEGFRLSNESSINLVKMWKRIRNANIVSIHEAFTTNAFGDSSIVFVYDYHPLSITLYEKYFGQYLQKSSKSHDRDIISEHVLWGYFIQIISAIKYIHAEGLAVRILDLTKILLTEKNRLRLNCCGIMDVILPGFRKNDEQLQNHDFTLLGQLILILACNSLTAIENIKESFDYVIKHYSKNFQDVVFYLFKNELKSIDKLVVLVSSHIIDSFNSSLCYNDTLESELCRELENGRLVRLLCKFGFINERPEFDHDELWSETGDRYLIKLLRDYVFHQVDENGNPVVDMAHVITCLNKLDAGVDEKIMLVSRDEQNCLIVSYKELKNCIQSAFLDLTKNSQKMFF
ncbi:unnamed protein product [Pneumocystis jirovecii]|uniref:PAN2-PAN3 deadenylation complex subunit PAN3 n=2 Tax=Pneumocystis jirovecii TaxID=42068 RepID=L0PF74_PNEJI|nr:uncharacterized protein T551_00988 [Pneumocystis jirovecii RU7]KTW31727.1 hypothetical protein T551_00988 [Pneumocystis jirovecii RU7]CCJ30290.1 unnamed protein product [Pneumocystis jirovecii]